MASDPSFQPVDTSLGGVVFKLDDGQFVCHIWKPQGLLNNGDLSCKRNMSVRSAVVTPPETKVFEFDSEGYRFTVERKVYDGTLCYTLRNGSTGAISCL
jgi:hypothetical protein